MRVIARGWVLIGLAMALVVGSPMSGQVALTTVSDTVYSASGTPAQGTVVVSWSAFTTADGKAVAAGQTSASLGPNGALSIALAPNAGAIPTGSYYTAVFHLSDGTTSRQYWVLPVSAGPVQLAGIENTVLPTNVAMQTVSKAYVDRAIANAVTTGVPPAAATGQTYVQKSGDTMTGPLVLPGDPVSSLQAADKHYVDVNIAALGGGSATKVSTLPSASQTVVQPAGTQLEVNYLNGVLDASGWLTGNGNNGVGNALGSSNCTGGCEVSVSQSYPGFEGLPGGGLPFGTHIVDHRGGAEYEVQQDPLPASGTSSVGRTMLQVTTRSAQQMHATRPSTGSNSIVMSLAQNALTGGSNQFPADVEAVPYNKNNYGVLEMIGNYNTQGQHAQMGNVVNCFAVGDCLAGGQFITSSGGYRDEADEGAHPFDLQVSEDSQVYQGTCGTGCTTGSTSVMVNATGHAGTQGDGRFLMDKSPSKVLTTGMITGAGQDLLALVNISGANFPVSTQLVTAAAATSQAGNLSPGTVTLPIATGGLPGNYATSTAALPASTGVACVADQGSFPNFETATYAVVDGSHLQLTLNKVHKSAAVVAVGGLCGYGLEQTADTMGAVRQIFPVIGSPTAGQLYYAPSLTYVAGISGGVSTGGFLTAASAIASATRSGNVVTLTLAQPFQYDMNGLKLTISGVADASYNGTFAVTTTGPASFTYAASGPDGSSTGGTVTFSSGGYALYPMAEVLSVYDPATASVDGLFTLAPNTVAWAAGDPVEEPHFYQQATYGDTEYITQFVPRPTQYASAGKNYKGLIGPGARGWQITNAVPASTYLGAGGTHQPPDSAYVASGVWANSMEVDAGTQSVLRVHCNLNGCSRWDSLYALFAMDRTGGVEDFLFYSPASSTASWLLGGTNYSFSPSAFTAPNVNATSVNTNVLSTNRFGLGTGSPSYPFQLGGSGALGEMVWSGTGGANPWFGIYDSANQQYYGISASLPSPAGTSTLGGFFSGLGISGSTSNQGRPVFGVLNSATANMFNVNDDGSGTAAQGHVSWDANGNVQAASYHETLRTPASSSAACNAGDFADDANFHYVCVGTNSWKRVALAAF